MRAIALLCLSGCSFIAAAGGDYNPKRSTPPSCGTPAVQVLDGAIATLFAIPSTEALVHAAEGTGTEADRVGGLAVVIAVPFIASTLFGIYENHVCGVELDELEAKSKQPARVDP